MDRNIRKTYAAPVLVGRGSLTTRTLETIMDVEREELQPDKYRIASSL